MTSLPPRTRLAAAGALLATLALAAPAGAATLVGLTADGRLVRFDSETRRAGAPVAVRGAEGRLVGIDVRPADGRLYGLTDAGQIVTLDPASGRATAVSRLSETFAGGGRVTMDFNPVADRLRLLGVDGTSFRVKVEDGMVTRDGGLKYQPGTPLAETAPRVTAGAYTNSMAGAKETALYTLDSTLGQLNLQAPPNDGVQQPRGLVAQGAGGLPPAAAFDILAEGEGRNTAYLLAGGTLHTVSLADGKATALGPVAGAAEVIDIAAMR